MDRELRLEPEWWADWWGRFQRAQWRNVKKLVALLAAVAVLGALVAAVTYVQADNLRDDQAATLAILERIEDRQEGVEEDAEVVAAFVRELRAQQAAQPQGNPQTADALATIRRIGRWIEEMTGTTLPPDPSPPTTR